MKRALSRRAVPAALVGLVTACTIGTGAHSFRPAQGPAGVEVRARTTTGMLHGELLSVADTGLIVVSAERVVVLVPLAVIRRATFAQMRASERIQNGSFVSARGRDRVRLSSRYPQGMTVPLLRRLLDAYGQAAIHVVGR